MACDEPPTLVYTLNIEKDLGNNIVMLKYMIISQVSSHNIQILRDVSFLRVLDFSLEQQTNRKQRQNRFMRGQIIY